MRAAELDGFGTALRYQDFIAATTQHFPDQRPHGVFIFRFEQKDALLWPREPVAMTPDGRVPVIYRVNLKDPSSFFVMQSFPINNKDVLYVSDAPVAELQKFMNIVFTIVYPVLNAKQTFGF